MLRIGFSKSDITPRVGVQLAGFGPFRNRHSVAVRDRLFARAMAVELGAERFVLASCDLIGTTPEITAAARQEFAEATGWPAEAVMVHATHTHSGPGVGAHIGWGEADPPYIALLPGRIARACASAVASLAEARVLHAEAPCEGLGLNREYDRDAPPLDEVLADNWRPARPELTDRTCHVLRVESGGRTVGFLSYFGCHPVVCCAETRHIHGDFCGVATNLLEKELGGAVGLFLQGAQGDVNSCVVHKPEAESLRALDVIAERYARAVRAGLAAATPLEIDRVARASHDVVFRRKRWSRDDLGRMLSEQESIMHARDADDADANVRMAMVKAIALRKMIRSLDAGETLEPPVELQGLRLGPVAFLGTPFEVFQEIKNEVTAAARAPIPLVMGLTNDGLGYAVDRTVAARGGYAADLVPLMCGSLPFDDVHTQLVAALLDLDRALF